MQRKLVKLLWWWLRLLRFRWHELAHCIIMTFWAKHNFLHSEKVRNKNGYSKSHNSSSIWIGSNKHLMQDHLKVYGPITYGFIHRSGVIDIFLITPVKFSENLVYRINKNRHKTRKMYRKNVTILFNIIQIDLWMNL